MHHWIPLLSARWALLFRSRLLQWISGKRRSRPDESSGFPLPAWEGPKEENSRPHALVSTSAPLLDHQSSKVRVPITSDLTKRSRGRRSAYLMGGSPTLYDSLWIQALPWDLNPITMNIIRRRRRWWQSTRWASFVIPGQSERPKRELVEIDLTDKGEEVPTSFS